MISDDAAAAAVGRDGAAEFSDIGGANAVKNRNMIPVKFPKPGGQSPRFLQENPEASVPGKPPLCGQSSQNLDEQF